MKLITIFNNKGGVGKTTLLYHLAYSLSELNKKVLLLDLDPQCNLTINSLSEDKIQSIWEAEDSYIEDYKTAKDSSENYKEFAMQTHSIHFILKPLEDGLDFDFLPKPLRLSKNIDIIPGRLSLQFFESYVSRRWSEAFTGNPHAIRTISSIRNLAERYAKKYKYDFVLIDTSPSLGDLNKISVALSDYFFIPCSPDIFSIYGIRNIGAALKNWSKEFNVLLKLLPENQLSLFPKELVKLLGYSLYRCQKKSDAKNKLQIPQAHYNYVHLIPDEIIRNISKEFINSEQNIKDNIGGTSIIYTHNTLTSMAQKYHHPIWLLPNKKEEIDKSDFATISGNRSIYLATRGDYKIFAQDILSRIGE